MATIIAPDVMHTKLDEVFYAQYDYDEGPGFATAETSALFNQKTATGDQYFAEEWGGVGAWEETEVDEERPITTVRVANQKTVYIANYNKTVAIPIEYWEDAKHDLLGQIPRAMGMRARTTRDENAMAVYVGGFGTTTTGQGSYLFSNSHTNVNGDTVDNLETGALSDANFEILYRTLIEQKGVDGEPGVQIPRTLLVPPALWPTAGKVLNSELESGTTDNDINWWKYVSQTYANITLYQSVYVGTQYASSLNSNANTSYYLTSSNHSVGRWVRTLASTAFVDAKYSGQWRNYYKGRYREKADAITYTGVCASNGTT